MLAFLIVMKQLLDKLKGTIYGQAIDDALGLGTEGMDVYDMAWKYPNGFLPTIVRYSRTTIVADGKKVTGLMTPT